MEIEPIRAAIEKAGSVKALAEYLEIRPQAISQWRRVPRHHVLALHRLTGISVEDLLREAA